MYNVTLYINTGFNSVNSPDKTSLLDNAAYNKVTVPAIDIYQIQEMETIRINVTSYASIRDADYALIVNDQDATDFGFFSVENITMTDLHTAVISLLINPILTVVGTTGLSALEFTDGICERHHVARSDDDFGVYDEDDPYMIPAEPLQIIEETPQFNDTPANDAEAVLLVTTCDLYGMWKQFNQPNAIGEAPFGLDYNSPNASVTVPMSQSARIITKSRMAKDTYDPSDTDTYDETTMANLTVINADRARLWWTGENVDWLFPSQTNLYDGLGIVRGLGLESSIIAQYAIPYFMIGDSQFIDTSNPPAGYETGDEGHGVVQNLVGTYKEVTLNNLPFTITYQSQVYNNRLFYGELSKYTIVSIASGNQASFLPEDIFHGFATPKIVMRVDPRPNGCPYFRFDYFKGLTANSDLFFTNAVRGLQWQNVPITYDIASGALLNEYAYNASRAVTFNKTARALDMSYAKESAGNVKAITGMASSALRGVGRYAQAFDTNASSGAGANITANIGASIIDGITDMSINQAMEQNNRTAIEEQYVINRNKELQALMLSNYAVAPEINFPVSEGIRDYVGNTCIVYRYKFTENDAHRIDKILTMYGYKHTTPIEPSLLTNRSKFNYIEAKGVTIKNAGVPKWLRDAVGAQFASGVRFWHVPIDTSAYTDGSNT